jgi:hypothetical protein
MRQIEISYLSLTILFGGEAEWILNVRERVLCTSQYSTRTIGRPRL